MKTIKYCIFFLVVGAFYFTWVLADAVIKEFRIEPGVNKVQLVWKVSVETSVKGYKIQRGFAANQLMDIDFIDATPVPVPIGGTKDYTYQDQSVFKNDGRIFYYRIVVIDPQNREVTASEIMQVSAQISGVRHTWGSIKAMFR